MYQAIFNYIIMALYVINAGWWQYRGKTADALYWLFAFGITAVVTWGYKR
jgi:hypothetical protein